MFDFIDTGLRQTNQAEINKSEIRKLRVQAIKSGVCKRETESFQAQNCTSRIRARG